MKIVTRQEWGAAPSRGQTPLRGAKGVAVHWFGGTTPSGDHSACAPLVRSIQQGAFQRPDATYSDIEYNLLVCVHGYVFVGRGVGVMPAAQGAANASYFAVCALTGPSGGWTSPTDDLLNGLVDAIEDCRQTGPAGSAVVAHRSLMSTDCPGDALAAWIEKGANRPGATPPPPVSGGGQHVTVTEWPEQDSTLWGLATHYLHDGTRWPEIYEANKTVIGPNPNLVTAGMSLVIP